MSGHRALLAFDYFARYTAGLADGVVANGWPTALAYHRHDHAFGNRAGELERYLDRQLLPQIPRLAIHGRVRDPTGLRSWGRVARACRSWAPDIVHVQHCIVNDPRLVSALPLRRRRFALTIHDITDHPGDPRQPRYRTMMIEWLVRHAGLIFVHAETLKEDLIAAHAPNAPIEVVPHGIEPDDLGPLPQQQSLLFFGRISEYKGLNILLDAMPSVWRSSPDVTLTVAGDGPLEPHPVLEEPRVRLLHGHVPDADVPELFRAASLVVLPYIEASQSGVGSLAKGYGRPLLATAIDGLVELVADGSGELVAPGDANLLAERIVGLVQDREKLERLAAAGRRAAASKASWEGVAATTIEAYERHLLRGAAAPRGHG